MCCLPTSCLLLNDFFHLVFIHIFVQASNEKNESSASDEESLHLTRQKDKEKIQEDGPSYATVKKPKKMLQPSAQ